VPIHAHRNEIALGFLSLFSMRVSHDCRFDLHELNASFLARVLRYF
jgi:hypothetical protein